MVRAYFCWNIVNCIITCLNITKNFTVLSFNRCSWSSYLTVAWKTIHVLEIQGGWGDHTSFMIGTPFPLYVFFFFFFFFFGGGGGDDCGVSRQLNIWWNTNSYITFNIPAQYTCYVFSLELRPHSECLQTIDVWQDALPCYFVNKQCAFVSLTNGY